MKGNSYNGVYSIVPIPLADGGIVAVITQVCIGII